ncbi:MAG: 50S ribosomal protein L21 [Rickettsiales bacterium]|nr:50S ribosomal protein L21 [Rickettsiales bacterium]|tara:strand:+ start:211 stop:609 length:399 start_codon:yes stop_codon:yes gene_type:complete
MFAVIKFKDKQYKVSKGDFLKIPDLKDSKKNDKMKFEEILIVKNEKDVLVGSPLVKGAYVEAKIVDRIRDKKIIVFKKKRRHNYRRKMGHRQNLTLVKIEDIQLSSKKIISNPNKESPEIQQKDMKGETNGS